VFRVNSAMRVSTKKQALYDVELHTPPLHTLDIGEKAIRRRQLRRTCESADQ